MRSLRSRSVATEETAGTESPSERTASLAGATGQNAEIGRDADAVKFADLSVELGLPATLAPLPYIYASAAAHNARCADAAARAADALPAELRAAGGEAVMQRFYSALANPAKKPAARQALEGLVHRFEPDRIEPNTRRFFIWALTQLDALAMQTTEDGIGSPDGAHGNHTGCRFPRHHQAHKTDSGAARSFSPNDRICSPS